MKTSFNNSRDYYTQLKNRIAISRKIFTTSFIAKSVEIYFQLSCIVKAKIINVSMAFVKLLDAKFVN